MSWQISFSGKPEAIQRALRAHSNNLSGLDKTLYNTARPTLEQLVDLNASEGDLILSASGSSNNGGDEDVNGTVSVVLMPLNAIHVR